MATRSWAASPRSCTVNSHGAVEESVVGERGDELAVPILQLERFHRKLRCSCDPPSAHCRRGDFSPQTIVTFSSNRNLTAVSASVGNSKGHIFRRASSQEAVRAPPNIGTKTVAPYDSSGLSESLWAVLFRGGKYPSGLAEIRWLCKEPRLPAEGVKEPGCMRAAEQGTAACTRILTCYM